MSHWIAENIPCQIVNEEGRRLIEYLLAMGIAQDNQWASDFLADIHQALIQADPVKRCTLSWRQWRSLIQLAARADYPHAIVSIQVFGEGNQC